MKWRSIVLVVLLGITSACSLAWGRSFHIVDANEDMIKIKFYRATVNETRMNETAATHCAKFSKNAVLEDTEGNDEFVNTYRCVVPTGFRPVIEQPESLN